MEDYKIVDIAQEFVDAEEADNPYAWHYITKERAQDMFCECIRTALDRSAAPDMLQALEFANETFSKFMRDGVALEEYPAILMIRSAIAKAKGE